MCPANCKSEGAWARASSIQGLFLLGWQRHRVTRSVPEQVELQSQGCDAISEAQAGSGVRTNRTIGLHSWHISETGLELCKMASSAHLGPQSFRHPRSIGAASGGCSLSTHLAETHPSPNGSRSKPHDNVKAHLAEQLCVVLGSTPPASWPPGVGVLELSSQQNRHRPRWALVP